MIYLKKRESKIGDLKLAYAKPYAELTHAYARAAKHNFFSLYLCFAYAGLRKTLRKLTQRLENRISIPTEAEIVSSSPSEAENRISIPSEALCKSLRKSLRKLTQKLTQASATP